MAGDPATPIFFLNAEEFGAPLNYVGTGRGAGHLIIEARREADSPPRPCFDGELVEEQRIAGRPVAIYECPGSSERLEREIRHGEGAHVDHLLYAWSQNGIDYAASAHGHARANRELLARIVRSIQLVEPAAP